MRHCIAITPTEPATRSWQPASATSSGWNGTRDRTKSGPRYKSGTGLGDDLANDFLVNVKEGEFYGWPHAYNGPHAEPRHAEDENFAEFYDAEVHAEMVAKTLYPDVLLGSHVAVLDMKFYTGTQFPEEYRGGLFMAFHGSWNRAARIGYSVTFIPFKDGPPAIRTPGFPHGVDVGIRSERGLGTPGRVAVVEGRFHARER